MGLELFEGGWPTKEFDQDLKVLVTVKDDDLSKLANWFKSWNTIGHLSDEETRRLRKLFPERGKWQEINTCLSVTFHVLREWGRLNLSLAQLTKDFQTLGLEDGSIKKLQGYFQSLEDIKQKAHLDYLKLRDAERGIPVFESVVATWNIRALFEEDQDGLNIGEVVEHVPIAIVTIETKYSEQPRGESTRTIMQFTREYLADFLNALNKFAELGEKLEKKP
jgi:hypothetical protein